jgi:hypothetical protein
VNWVAIALVVGGTAVGWGLVTTTGWMGYLLGGAEDAWGGANLGVLAALVIGFAGTLLNARRVRAQEARG